jgi:hypothetical protein
MAVPACAGPEKHTLSASFLKLVCGVVEILNHNVSTREFINTHLFQ